ncbi:MAG TPA: BadF/BadG/BcrA/BcrD ATPase family protein [Candidatus Baltobacteraceae bacterium]|nr:BadF/BadG/BcrA/BcrD ATPase family protein [Candidatus Baltobacteraceae bacterium]
MSEYFAGIDGGQSSTTAVIGDGDGRILGRGAAGPCDEIGQGPESTRLRDALESALDRASRAAGLPPDVRFRQIVAGVSGYEGRIYGQTPALPATALSIVHDSEIAHAGALAGDAGVIVIAGTGSVAFAKDRAARAMVGGWGYLFGDEGGAFWMAREAVCEAMRDADAGEPSEFGALALERFSQPSLRHLARAFYAGEITRADFAAFSIDVMRCAQRGNASAARLVQTAAKELVSLASEAIARARLGADCKIAFVGGLLQSAALREQVMQRVRSTLPAARIAAPKFDAPTGALLLAYRLCGNPAEPVS